MTEIPLREPWESPALAPPERIRGALLSAAGYVLPPALALTIGLVSGKSGRAPAISPSCSCRRLRVCSTASWTDPASSWARV